MHGRQLLDLPPLEVPRPLLAPHTSDVFEGVLAGALGAPAIASAMQGDQDLLVGTVSAADQLAIIGSVSLLVFAAIFAAWAPAWRATRIDPMKALRHE
jgi:ABC-type antimicrobial peptide transport system permease subunit